MCTIQNSFQRIETKYLLFPEQYAAMRRGMLSHMRPDEHSRYTICNIYYDTEDYSLIRTSLDKPVYKEKLRLRSYGVPDSRDSVFVELKKKYDGVVYKRRITTKSADAERAVRAGILPPADQISREINWFLRSYRPRPAAFIGYDREAWSGIEDEDLRITFDTNLRGRDCALDLRAGDFGELFLPGDLILMELKLAGGAPMWLSRLLSENGIFSSSFSKYGTYYKHLMGRAPVYGDYHTEVKRYA
jgi:hypothetical protein